MSLIVAFAEVLSSLLVNRPLFIASKLDTRTHRTALADTTNTKT